LICKKLKHLQKLDVRYCFGQLNNVTVLRQLVHLEELWLTQQAPAPSLDRFRMRDVEMIEFNKNFPRILPQLKVYNGNTEERHYYREVPIDVSKLLVRQPCALEEVSLKFKKNSEM